VGLPELLLLAACSTGSDPGFEVLYGTGVDDGTPTAPSGGTDPGVPVDPLDLAHVGAWREPWIEPLRVALAPDGTLRVSEPRQGLVYALDAEGQLLSAVQVGGEPLAVGVDGDGRTWVGDGATGEIRVYDPAWKVVFVAGTGAGEAERPADLAIDPQTGWVYVTDSPANLVRVYDADGNALTTFDGGADGDTSLLFPTGVAKDGVWVVSHLLKRVVKFDAIGRVVGWFGVHGENPGELYTPQGVWADDLGRIWVADARLGRVTAFDGQGRYLGFAGSVGRGPGQLNIPMDVVIDAANRLIVTSANNARLELYDVPGSGR
jgi:DNA-binding beta-propeller fold protein YncE